MTAPWHDLIADFHRQPVEAALVLTGGGTSLAGALLSVPGGSRTVLEVAVPYDERATVQYLGHTPESFCSAAASREFARRAFDRASALAGRRRSTTPGQPLTSRLLGIACTASLQSDRPKRGAHRAHLTIDDGRSAVTHSLTLTKGARDRAAEEELLGAVMLNRLAEAVGMARRVLEPLLPDEAVITEVTKGHVPLSRFFAGNLAALRQGTDGRLTADATPTPRLVLPGSFNPLHDGHCRLLEAAARQLDLRPDAEMAFELAVCNADKPTLADAEVRWRMRQFVWRAPLWLTRAATFVEKARLFPGATFVVGHDTAHRIVDPRFYEGDPDRMRSALSELQDRGCTFLVAGRERDGCYRHLGDVAVPPDREGLFRPIAEAEFRMDLSSTELRSR